MSYEHCDDPERVDPCSDAYSFGVVVYEALSGRPPFRDADPAPLIADARARGGRRYHPENELEEGTVDAHEIVPVQGSGETERKGGARKWWIVPGTGLGVLVAVGWVFFSAMPIQFQVDVAEDRGVLASIARFHLRYLRSFDPNATNKDGDPLLHVAFNSFADLPPRPGRDAVILAVAEILLARGAEIDTPGGDGAPLLIHALEDYNDEKALALLSLGASPRARGEGEYAAKTAASVLSAQVSRDMDAFPRLLRCDPELLDNSEYWEMVLLRFAMRTAGIDPRDCRPLDALRIEALLAEHGRALRRERMFEAMGTTPPTPGS